MRTEIIAATAATFLMSGASFADPTGRYTVRGTNPGDSKPYTGQVLVARTGQTYQVLWSIGGQTYAGTGIGSADFLAVTYRAGPGIGLAIYNRKPDGIWYGIWTYGGGREIGTDVWTPQAAAR